MKAKLISIGLALALVAIPSAALAGHGNGNAPHEDYPGWDDAAAYGICTAYDNNENGRDNGQAGEAPPFQELEDRAEESDQDIQEWCADNGQHPGQGEDNGQP